MERAQFNIAIVGDVKYPMDDIVQVTLQHTNFILQPEITGLAFECDGVICEDSLREQLIEKFDVNTPFLTTSEWQDIEHLDRFFIQLYTKNRFDVLANDLTSHRIITFHSKLKYLLMAYSPQGYQATGKMVASISQHYDLLEFYEQYREKILAILSQTPTRKLHVNAIQHIQGYFKHKATKDEKTRLGWLINDYLLGYLSINNPLSMILQLLTQYPDSYISEQYYLSPYPECRKVRALLQL